MDTSSQPNDKYGKFREAMRSMQPDRYMVNMVMALILPLACNFAVAQSAQTPGVSKASLIQTLLGLLFVIALLFALVYFLRRFSNLKAFGAKGPLRIAGGLMIGPRERILLVEVEETWLVIGIVPGQIRTLHTLPKGALPLIGSESTDISGYLKRFETKKGQ